MKVYCMNCKYSISMYKRGKYSESDFSHYICEKKIIHRYYTEHYKAIKYMNVEKLNKNGDCKYYKRKWWYFWVRSV